MNKEELSFQNHILKKINGNYSHSSTALKKISKKNCDTNENKFSIKILKTKDSSINIGLTDSNFDYLSSNYIGSNSHSWDFYCCNGRKYHNGVGIKFGTDRCEINDVISLKYDSKKGEIEIFKNNVSLGIMFNGLDTSKDYNFGIGLYDINDEIQIIQN